MTEKLTVLFTPLNGWGHINCCHGLAEELKARGHRVVFAIDKAFKDKLTPYGFEEQLHGLGNSDGAEYWPKFMERYCHVLKEEPIVIAEKYFLPATEHMFDDIRHTDSEFEAIIDRVKPNVIISDNYVCSPTLTHSGIPWVWLFSAAPHLALMDERIPPPWSGLPINGDKKLWKHYREQWNGFFKEFHKNVSDYCVSKGAPKLDDNRLHPFSPYLNIYLYPQELDFNELKPIDNKWIRVENFMRTTNETFDIPEPISKGTGKLVFLSMGSFGSANLELMTRLVRILGKSKHRYIVSKGALHDKYDLPDNMWGKGFIPQTAIIPMVSLVITHGGNNTVTETFFYGKPMIVLPLFGDQFDNAQRVEETGLGVRLNPFLCTEDQLLSSVDRLLSDERLSERMTAIGQRIRSVNDKQIVSELIENIFV